MILVTVEFLVLREQLHIKHAAAPQRHETWNKYQMFRKLWTEVMKKWRRSKWEVGKLWAIKLNQMQKWNSRNTLLRRVEQTKLNSLKMTDKSVQKRPCNLPKWKGYASIPASTHNNSWTANVHVENEDELSSIVHDLRPEQEPNSTSNNWKQQCGGY